MVDALGKVCVVAIDKVYPACSFNLSQVAGEWAGFDPDWLERRILCGGGRRAHGGGAGSAT